jgi:hypothetical protein
MKSGNHPVWKNYCNTRESLIIISANQKNTAMKTLTAIVAGLTILGATHIEAQETGTTAPSSDGFHRMEIGFRFMPTFSAFDVRTSRSRSDVSDATIQ